MLFRSATTTPPGAASHWIRLPGPVPGPYRLVLEARHAGPYRVRVMLGLTGRELFAREWSGTARAAEQLSAELIVDASEGVPYGGQAGDLRPLIGPAPGKFVNP